MPTEKTQEHAAVEKPHSKPGRKPVNSEPKNKRTAQNRAAQRAFRERKEKRMKELEDKVSKLEKEKVEMANESELLRNQISLLLKQISRNNVEPGTSIEDSLFNSISMNKNLNTDTRFKLENDDDLDQDSESLRVDASPDDDKSLNNISSNSSISSATPGKVNDDIFNLTSKDLNSLNDFNLDLRNKLNNKSFKGTYDEQVFCNELSSACGSKECIIPKAKLKSSNITTPVSLNSGMTTPSIMSSSNKSIRRDSLADSLFDSDINGDINYITKNVSIDDLERRPSAKSSPFMMNFDPYFNQDNTKNINFNNTDSTFQLGLVGNNDMNKNATNHEMDFLSTNNETMKEIENNPSAFQLDPNSAILNTSLMYGLDLDFDNNDDVFDDLLNLPNKPENLDNVIGGTSNNDDADDDNEKVPDNTQDLMKCSQIWERITTYPRFTDLDIDNLCDELKQKAKCSEAGVVVDGSEVGKLLNKAVSEQRRYSQTKRDVEIKKLALSSSNGFLQGMW